MTSFFDEAKAAARGVFGLLIGDKRVGGSFDFSQRGLAGSFIALLIVTGLNAGLPLLVGQGTSGIARAVTMAAILFALQIGFSTIVLRQLNRMDGLVPYLVADNWATFYMTLISTALGFVGFDGEAALVIFGIVVIIIEINIARLIVTLSPLQIAMFMIAQLVGISIGLAIISFAFPLPPDVVAQFPS